MSYIPHNWDIETMRFAIVTIDKYLPIFNAFIEADWTPIKLFSETSKQKFGDSQQAVSLSNELGIPIQLTRITSNDLEELHLNRCDILIVAGYRWKIPNTKNSIPFAINFHPSPLPIGRGPFPLPRAILEQYPEWAVSCHKLTDNLDSGDVIVQKKFSLSPDETLESLDIKTQYFFRHLVRQLTEKFHQLWSQAIPQNEGSYWPWINDEERIFQFSWTVQKIRRHIEAYGEIGSLVFLGGRFLTIRKAVIWQDKHEWSAGHIIDIYHYKIVVAVSDCIIVFTDFSFVS